MVLTIVAHPTHVRADVTGVFNPGEAEDFFVKIMAACEEHKLPLALVDVRSLVFLNPLSTFHRFEISSFVADRVTHLQSTGLGRVQVAFVADEKITDKTGFGETVASNRGAAVRITSDIAEALTWLGVDPMDAP